MKKYAFIGGYDKIEILLFLGKIAVLSGKRVLIIDGTVPQKARYVVPVMNAAPQYITTFEDIDIAVGFYNFNEILEYTYKDDYNMLKRVLFLYNVETAYKQGLEFFPFERYKDYDWTLEHIHAQNSERIDHSIKDKWIEWF